MKKQFFLLSLVFLAIANLFSQDISINLSIRWSEGPYILNPYSIVKYPELVVSYTNNSNENIYFRKFPYYRNGIPDFGWVELINIHDPEPEVYLDYPGYLKKHKFYTNIINRVIKNEHYKDNNYVVSIELPSFSSYESWYVERIEDNISDEIEWINSDLRDINNFINDSVFKNLNYVEDKITFYTSSDITETTIMNEMEYQFMFLKSGETKEDVFNLTCFYMARGTYKFILKGDKFDDSVFSGWNDYGNKSFIPLPEKVDEFKLYSGEFTANSVTVTF